MRYIIVCLIGLSIFASAMSRSETQIDPTTIIRLSGNGYERGLAQGRKFQQEIREILELFFDSFISNAFVKAWALRESARMEPYIPKELRDEIRGIADATGVKYADALVANVAPDLLELAGEEDVACSVLFVMPFRTATGGALLGRNLDWDTRIKPVFERMAHPVVYEAPGKRKILAISVPGLVGVLTGINEAGVSVSIMTVSHEDQTSQGIPISMLYRKALESAGNFDQAMSELKQTPRTIAVNTLLSTEQRAVVLEMTSSRTSVRQPSINGVLYAANHHETPEMIGQKKPDRDWRWPILSRWDATKEPMSFEAVRKTVGEVAVNSGEMANVMAFFVDYSGKRVIYSRSGVPAASGTLYEIKLDQAFH